MNFFCPMSFNILLEHFAIRHWVREKYFDQKHQKNQKIVVGPTNYKNNVQIKSKEKIPLISSFH